MRRLLVTVLASLAALLGVPSIATAATASPAYDGAAYAYDAPPLLSPQSATASHVGGSPLGADVGSWGSSVSARDCCVAANAVVKAPQVLRVGDVVLPAVPKGAVGTAPQTGKGLEYVIPRGTPEISERVATVRIMDPVTSGKYQYPNGYAVYMNEAGQTVNPLTGQTIANSDPLSHIPLPR